MKNIFNILLIEDNKDDYMAVNRAFQSCEESTINVNWLDSSSLALDHLNKINTNENNDLPDIIILDLNMPGIDGREILKATREMSRMKLVPIIILSTSDDQNDIKQCYETGANSYIQKPVSYNKLKEVCKKIETYWLKTVILPE